MDRLEYVAKALLVYETLDADQFLKAFNKELSLDVSKPIYWYWLQSKFYLYAVCYKTYNIIKHKKEPSQARL